MGKKLLIIILLLLGTSSVQAQKVYMKTIKGVDHAVIDCTGMPKGSVKTQEEQKASKTADGRVVRHYQHRLTAQSSYINGTTTAGANNKVSPRFLVGHCQIKDDGTPDTSSGTSFWAIQWHTAAGLEPAADHNLDDSASTLSAATGCAAYRGHSGSDPKGSWRLPTQRELMLIWTLLSKIEVLGLSVWTPFRTGFYAYYWCATEQDVNAAYYVDFQNGRTGSSQKDLGGYGMYVALCVRDVSAADIDIGIEVPGWGDGGSVDIPVEPD